MPEKYDVDCSCGNTILVELWNAGSNVNCPKCKGAVKVPNSVQLKKQAGDKYPHLSPLQKIQQTSTNQESPFQGICHSCNQSIASSAVTVLIRDLQERAINEPEHAIIPVVTPWAVGAMIRKGEIADERWDTAIFRVYLCEECLREYECQNRWKIRWKFLAIAAASAVLIGVPYSLWNTNYEPVFTIGGSLILAAFVIFGLFPDPQRYPIYDLIGNIDPVAECLNASMEYELIYGTPESCDPLRALSSVSAR